MATIAPIREVVDDELRPVFTILPGQMIRYHYPDDTEPKYLVQFTVYKQHLLDPELAHYVHEELDRTMQAMRERRQHWTLGAS